MARKREIISSNQLHYDDDGGDGDAKSCNALEYTQYKKNSRKKRRDKKVWKHHTLQTEMTCEMECPAHMWGKWKWK